MRQKVALVLQGVCTVIVYFMSFPKNIANFKLKASFPQCLLSLYHVNCCSYCLDNLSYRFSQSNKKKDYGLRKAADAHSLRNDKKYTYKPSKFTESLCNIIRSVFLKNPKILVYNIQNIEMGWKPSTFGVFAQMIIKMVAD